MKPVFYLLVCPSLILITSFGVLARHLIGDAMPDMASLLTTATTAVATVVQKDRNAANATRQPNATAANANAERQRAERRENDRRENERRERDKEKQAAATATAAAAAAAAATTTDASPELPDDLPPVPVPDNRDRTAFIPPYKGRVQGPDNRRT